MFDWSAVAKTRGCNILKHIALSKIICSLLMIHYMDQPCWCSEFKLVMLAHSVGRLASLSQWTWAAGINLPCADTKLWFTLPSSFWALFSHFHWEKQSKLMDSVYDVKLLMCRTKLSSAVYIHLEENVILCWCVYVSLSGKSLDLCSGCVSMKELQTFILLYNPPGSYWRPCDTSESMRRCKKCTLSWLNFISSGQFII